MSDLLVSIILAVCPPSVNGGTNECMEQMVNCAVSKKESITNDSIKKCLAQIKSN